MPILDDADATGSVTEFDGLTSYSVVMPVDGEVVSTLQEAVDLVAAEGFTGETAVTTEGDRPLPVVLNLEDPEMVAILTAAAVDGGGTLVTYTVEVS